MILWNLLSLKPNPFSPVHKARKFSETSRRGINSSFNFYAEWYNTNLQFSILVQFALSASNWCRMSWNRCSLHEEEIVLSRLTKTAFHASAQLKHQSGKDQTLSSGTGHLKEILYLELQTRCKSEMYKNLPLLRNKNMCKLLISISNINNFLVSNWKPASAWMVNSTRFCGIVM